MNALIDPFGRQIEYLRLSVTDRCDLRCFYCLPKGYKSFEQPENWLTFAEIERIVAAFGELGVRRIRITGGEPLLRHKLPDLAQRLAELPGIEDLSLSTNAVQLAKQASALYKAKITRLNVSLDSLDPQRFKQITGGKLTRVLDGLMAAKQVGFQPIKINMVVMKGINDDEAEAMLEFCARNGFTLRFIETMPLGDTGRNAGNHYFNLNELRKRLESRYELVPGIMPGGGPARYLQLAGSDLRIAQSTLVSKADESSILEQLRLK